MVPLRPTHPPPRRRPPRGFHRPSLLAAHGPRTATPPAFLVYTKAGRIRTAPTQKTDSTYGGGLSAVRGRAARNPTRRWAALPVETTTRQHDHEGFTSSLYRKHSQSLACEAFSRLRHRPGSSAGSMRAASCLSLVCVVSFGAVPN
uniref:Uncharacterized protein n=1 Tax=Mycena chlorophos TaxID=658473 RepID=A0ABQ0LSN0_MYCCL|nr:predicted protein [Mycena chlorophos]